MNICLERLQDKHISALQKLANDPLVSKTSGVPYPCVEDVVRECLHNNQADHPKELAFVILADSEIVGACILKKIDHSVPSAELTYWIGYQHWGRGIGSAAAKQMRDDAFCELGLQRLDAHVLRDNNKASQRILERLGFERDVARGELAVERRFEAQFPGDAWVFYQLSREKWLCLCSETVSNEIEKVKKVYL